MSEIELIVRSIGDLQKAVTLLAQEVADSLQKGEKFDSELAELMDVTKRLDGLSERFKVYAKARSFKNVCKSVSENTRRVESGGQLVLALHDSFSESMPGYNTQVFTRGEWKAVRKNFNEPMRAFLKDVLEGRISTAQVGEAVKRSLLEGKG